MKVIYRFGLAVSTFLLSVIALTAGASAASARDQAYVGTWAANPAQCRIGQELEDAPLVIKARRYDQHETHCEFRSVVRQGAQWLVKAQCSVQGDKQTSNFTLAVDKDRLTRKEGGGVQTYRLCP